MKRIIHTISICLFLILSLNINAQNTVKSSIWESISNHQSSLDYFANKHQSLGILSPKDMLHVSTITTKNGWSHHKYNQTYKGLDVLTGVYILHEKDGLVKKANGRILPNINQDIHPAIGISSARGIAENSVLTTLVLSERLNENNYVDFVPKFNKQKLCIADKGYPNHTGEYALAWIFDMDHQCWPPKKDQYIVDAHTGDIISSISLLHHQNIEIEVETRYYGKRNIIVDSISPTEFVLSDTTRGGGVFTVDGYDDLLFKSEDKNDWVIHDEDFESATDLHFCSEKYYDFLLEKFNRKSIDDNDFELRSVVHLEAGTNLVNAFWDGEKASFGEGNCSGYGPLTTLSIVGHEFTHGLTQMTSGLIYSGESGGLNEGISDILGKMLEYEITPNDFTWDLDSVFLRRPESKLFRSMRNPHLTNHPKYYKGINWFDEVHNTSNVLNFWYYLISDGEKSTNEKGDDYDVKAIGKDKAMQIVYSMQVNYLTPSSSYADAVRSSIEATTDLYGKGSELDAVKEAWRAVGLEIDSREVNNDLSIELDATLINSQTNHCAIGEIPIKITLYNNGLNTVNSGTNLKLKLIQDSKTIATETLSLKEDLISGNAVEYMFLEVASIEGLKSAASNIVVELSRNDDDNTNNTTTGDIRLLNSNVAGQDLRLFFVYGLNAPYCVGADNESVLLNFGVYIQNQGCELIEQGRELNMIISSGNNQVTHSEIIPRDFPPGGYMALSISLNMPLSSGPFNLDVELNNNWDVRATNDKSSAMGTVTKALDEKYVQDFTSFIPQQSTDISINGFNMAASKVSYNNSDMLGLTRMENLDTNALDNCTMLDRLLSPNFLTGSLDWCLNIDPKYIDPIFEFDMAQFRSSESSILDPLYQTIIVIYSPTDLSFDKQYIYGQNEGDIVHHKISLKNGFSESLRMELYSVFGNQSDLTQGNFNEIDAVLLDNINLSFDRILNNNNHANSTNIIVYPNPANDIVNFKIEDSDNQTKTIQIYDLMGREVHKDTKLSISHYQWNTSEVQSGIYLYDITKGTKSIGKGRIVVGR